MIPKAVSEQLGHGSVAITMDVYAPVTSEMQAQATAAMDAAFGQSLSWVGIKIGIRPAPEDVSRTGLIEIL